VHAAPYVWDDTCARGWVLRSLATGVVVPAFCRRLRCDVCRAREARRMVLALGAVGIERRVRLSLVGDEWQTVRGRVRRLGASLRRYTDGRWEWWWVCQGNPRGTGCHVHALVRGSYVPQRQLQRMCAREGLGIPWIGAHRPRHGRRGAAGTYELRELVGLYELRETGREALVLNGGRLAHWSRGWWGQPYRALLQELVADGSDPGPWVRERRPHPGSVHEGTSGRSGAL